MEKIQKALEKARRQRLMGFDDATAPQTREAYARGTCAPEAGEIVYSETRTIAAGEGTKEAQRIRAGFARQDLVDTFRILRTQVLHRLATDGHSTLAITSPNRGAGKTMTSVSLAISLARRVANTVLLVDLDLRRPSVHKYFSIEPQKGLSEYLLNGTQFASCLVHPGVERLVILPAGSIVHSSSELLSTPKMVDLVDEVKGRYPDRIVIYDLPPLLVTDDAIAFLHHVDGCILVIEDGKTRKGDVRRSLELLEGFNLIGTVLNKSKEVSGIAYY